MHSHKTSKDMTNSGRMLKHLSWNTQEKKHTPIFASKNSLMQQAKIQEKPWRKKMLLCVILQHIYFVIYPINVKILI